jgi:hypothetical protein
MRGCVLWGLPAFWIGGMSSETETEPGVMDEFVRYMLTVQNSLSGRGEGVNDSRLVDLWGDSDVA